MSKVALFAEAKILLRVRHCSNTLEAFIKFFTYASVVSNASDLPAS
jgi:hypothetical protein